MKKKNKYIGKICKVYLTTDAEECSENEPSKEVKDNNGQEFLYGEVVGFKTEKIEVFKDTFIKEHLTLIPAPNFKGVRADFYRGIDTITWID